MINMAVLNLKDIIKYIVKITILVTVVIGITKYLSQNQSNIKNRKQELFARRWGYEKVTLERIIEAIEHNCCNRYEVAEYLNVTDKYFSECIQNYRKKYGVNVRIGKYTLIFEPSFAVLINFRWKEDDVI